MKKWIRFFPAILVVFAALFLFSGCGRPTPFTINSVMNIHTNESGNRIITVSFAKSTLEDIFGNKNTSFQSFVTASCPDFVSWDYTETGNSYEMTFRIDFSSLDDYCQKVSVLTGLTDSVSILRPQVGVKTGFTLTETSDSAALFNWLKESMKNRSKMSGSKLDSLFVNGSNELYYAERAYEQAEKGLYAYVENLLDAEFIDILTEVTLEGTWNRLILIRFPSAMSDNAPNVKNYLTSLLPEGVTEQWENGTSWLLTFPASDIDILGERMNSLFQSQEKKSLSESVTARNALTFVHNFKEPLNLGFFAPSTGHTVVRYYLKDLSGAALSVVNSEGQTQDAVSLNNDYAGYTCLFQEQFSQGTLEYSAVYRYQPLEILAETEILGTEDVRREFTLLFGNTLPAVHRGLMLQAMLKRTDGFGELEEIEENGLYSMKFFLSGTNARVSSGFHSLFGGSADLEYTQENRLSVKPSLSGTVSDTMDFSDFLYAPEETLITAGITLSDNESLPDGSHFSHALFTGGISRLSFETTRSNPFRFWFIFFCVILVLFALYLTVSGPVRKYVAQRLSDTDYGYSAREKRSVKNPRTQAKAAQNKTSGAGVSSRGTANASAGKTAGTARKK